MVCAVRHAPVDAEDGTAGGVKRTKSGSAVLCAALLVLLSACAGNRLKPDPENDATRRQIVLDALGQVGRPYQYGGTSPDGFDCSGLVQYVYGLAGIKLPRTTREQHAYGLAVDMDDAEPGDLLFYSFGNGGIDHVAIYLGDDEAVHAPAAGRTVIVAGVHLKYWQSHFVDARRVFR
ncbi:C40 family peptidase [Solimonas terrae]|uniref:C40 family peptidase n=1 Tax=Solimonas terrae TaxID=1396819 RepID=A0A6M2BNG2_9GAMM|nr:C40 family peptidase [Solimonas terrae]